MQTEPRTWLTRLDHLLILEDLSGRNDIRVWIVTSAETFSNRNYYLNPDQIIWLENLEQDHMPIFTGRDNVTRVYCLGCTETSIK